VDYDAPIAFDYTYKFTLCLFAFITLLYHFHNLENQIRTQENSNKQNLAKYTYDICSDFRRPVMMEVNEHVRCLVKDQKNNLERHTIKDFHKYIEETENKEKRMALIVTLNYFESVSAMALAGDLDNEIVKRLFGKLFGRYYLTFQHYINYRQEEASKVWVNFEKLAIKWINDEKS